MIERYIELEGPDRGRITDLEIAQDLAYFEDAWREEHDGMPILDPPERPGKPIFEFEDIVNQELRRLIISKAAEELNQEFDHVYSYPRDIKVS